MDSDRKMFQGNWACGTCNNPITELPFEPDPSRVGQLKCRDCHQKSKDAGGNSGPKQAFSGNWACGSCGNVITELPFEPDPSRVSDLKCRDCFKNSQ